MTKQQTTPDRAELNAVVKQLAARDRPKAIAILAKYGALTTPQVTPEDTPAVHAEFVQALELIK